MCLNSLTTFKLKHAKINQLHTMKLQSIIDNIKTEEVRGNIQTEISSICIDSSSCTRGALFAAICGTKTDGHKYIDNAVENGAAAVLCQKIPDTTAENIVYIVVKDTSYALGIAACNFYDNPSKKLKLVGITGTNGKTTTATLLYETIVKMGYPCGLFSTVKIMINKQQYPSTHTTPNAIELNRIMGDMVEQGCEYCFMEVSSHAIDQSRIAGLNFTGGVFTNITQDHLDYHKTMDEYIAVKRLFFSNLPTTSFALTNIDDRNGAIMLQNSKARRYSYGMTRPADYKAKIISKQLEGMLLDIDALEMWTQLTGKFNCYNLLAVYATCIILGFDKYQTLTALSQQQPVKGRFELYKSKNGVYVIVDYAHTPDAVTNVLQTIKDIRTGNEKVITVIGAGGDRDKTKRPLMAHEAGKYSNIVILTSDNPRNEDPQEIIEQMLCGLNSSNNTQTLTITSRREAIKTACTLAKQGDIMLIAGKGHENYQEIKGNKLPFDDMDEAVLALKKIEN